MFTWPMKCHSPQVATLIPMMIPIVDAQCLGAAGAYLDAIVSDRLEAGSALARELGLGFAAKTACATQRSVAQGLAWAMIEIVFEKCIEEQQNSLLKIRSRPLFQDYFPR